MTRGHGRPAPPGVRVIAFGVAVAAVFLGTSLICQAIGMRGTRLAPVQVMLEMERGFGVAPGLLTAFLLLAASTAAVASRAPSAAFAARCLESLMAGFLVAVLLGTLGSGEGGQLGRLLGSRFAATVSQPIAASLCGVTAFLAVWLAIEGNLRDLASAARDAGAREAVALSVAGGRLAVSGGGALAVAGGGTAVLEPGVLHPDDLDREAELFGDSEPDPQPEPETRPWGPSRAWPPGPPALEPLSPASLEVEEAVGAPTAFEPATRPTDDLASVPDVPAVVELPTSPARKILENELAQTTTDVGGELSAERHPGAISLPGAGDAGRALARLGGDSADAAERLEAPAGERVDAGLGTDDRRDAADAGFDSAGVAVAEADGAVDAPPAELAIPRTIPRAPSERHGEVFLETAAANAEPELFALVETVADEAPSDPVSPELDVAPPVSPELDVTPAVSLALDRAARLVMGEGRASISFLQRRLGISLGDAQRLVSELESAGVVGPYRGTPSRDILLTLSDWEGRASS